jgi:competence protein ComEC
VEEKKIPLHVAEAGKTMLSTESLAIDIIAPSSEEYDDLNDYSAVISLIYGKTRFLFTGDAETHSEEEILASGVSLSADVLKLGHHGSSTSSSEAVVKAVNPKWGIISCGEGNGYGHPHRETLDLAKKLGIELLRTDLIGTIVMTSDGETVKYGDSESSGNADIDGGDTTTTAPEAHYHWILNTSSKKIHKEDCSYAESISEANRAESDKSVSELEAEGYSPCGSCKPKD